MKNSQIKVLIIKQMKKVKLNWIIKYNEMKSI